MDVRADLATEADVDRLFSWVEDLGTYPRWLDIVPRVEETAGDGAQAWLVTLRGRLGPLARSKRLRMVRTAHESPRRVVFERCEVDGRSHAPWVLSAEVRDDPSGATLSMHLHYGGRFLGGPMEHLLRQEIERSRGRLLQCLEEPPS